MWNVSFIGPTTPADELCWIYQQSSIALLPSLCAHPCAIPYNAGGRVQVWPLQFMVSTILRCCPSALFNSALLWPMDLEDCHGLWRVHVQQKRTGSGSIWSCPTPDPSVLFWLLCLWKSSLLYAVGPAVLQNIALNLCLFLSESLAQDEEVCKIRQIMPWKEFLEQEILAPLLFVLCLKQWEIIWGFCAYILPAWAAFV